MSNNPCDVLASRFAEKAGNGLKDVKFFVRPDDESGPEAVCHEVSGLYAAMDEGKFEPLDFNDLRWRESSPTV